MHKIVLKVGPAKKKESHAPKTLRVDFTLLSSASKYWQECQEVVRSRINKHFDKHLISEEEKLQMLDMLGLGDDDD